MYNEKIEKTYEERMNQLTLEELMILHVILQLSESISQKEYFTGDASLFIKALKNLGKVEVENECGETIKIRQKSIEKSFKKFQKMRLLEMDYQYGLPIFFPDLMTQL